MEGKAASSKSTEIWNIPSPPRSPSFRNQGELIERAFSKISFVIESSYIIQSLTSNGIFVFSARDALHPLSFHEDAADDNESHDFLEGE